MLRIFLIFYTLIGIISSAYAGKVQVTASVDKTNASLEDTITLSVKINGVRNSPSPKLSPINSFRIQNHRTSSSVRIINGQMDTSIIHEFQLQPKKEGIFIIDPITIEIKGKSYSSNPITLNIEPYKIVPFQNLLGKPIEKPPCLMQIHCLL